VETKYCRKNPVSGLREDILACIAYAAELARDCYVEIPVGETKVVAG